MNCAGQALMSSDKVADFLHLPGSINRMDVIIETPKGSNIKYAWDDKSGKYRAKKLLGHGLSFPHDFGYIPETIGDDGDPLDVMVVSECSTYPGVIINVRIIGCIRVRQSKNEPLIRNDRFLGIPEFSREFAEIRNIHQFPAYLLEQINGFLRNYVEAAGKKIIIDGLVDADEALEIIRSQATAAI